MLSKYNTSEPALHINEINVHNKYKFLSKIGQGSYGEVWLVLPIKYLLEKSHSKQYVLKRLDLRQTSSSQNDIESAEREAKLLSTLKHPNIVAYTESFRSNDGFLNIVMAYCEGGDLYTKLKERKIKKESLSENQIIEWFIQICMALQVREFVVFFFLFCSI
jgi:NIMA (never in mitosis gene a)-related kinase